MSQLPLRAALLLSLCFPLVAQNLRTILTAEPHKGAALPDLTADGIQLTVGGQRTPIMQLTPVRGEGIDLWLLLDDGLDTSVGSDLSELKDFIRQLPPYVNIGIGYLRNGGVLAAQAMTPDHPAAAGKLRLPIGMAGISGSPYTSLTDLIRRWPSTPRAREVLLISSGVDPLYGGGPQNPYAEQAVEAAQRAGIVVSAIYYGGAGHWGHSPWGIQWGQNYLSQLAEETGGEFYWQGLSNPVSFQPYLKDAAKRLDQQFFAIFTPPPGVKSGLQRARFTTELNHVSIVGPAQIDIPKN